MMRRELLVSGLMLAGALGCQGMKGPLGAHREVPIQYGGTMRLATYADVRNLDPALAFDTAAQAFEQLLFARLLDYDREGHIVPQLAERYEVSGDGKRYTFKLHEGVLFHDGTELLADDVKRSFERTLHHDTPCPAPSFYASIVGYDAFHDGTKDASGQLIFAPHLDGVVVDGRYALHIDLVNPDATFLPVLTLPFVAPLCKSAGSTYAREWGNHACGAGPFRLVEWQSSREIALDRHQGYFEPGKPYLDHVRWYLLMPQLTQRFKFEDGDLDHIRELTIPDNLAYQADPRWKPFGQWEPPKSTLGIFLNTQMKPFDNVELRRAFAAAINWDQIASSRPDTLVRATQMVPPAVPGYEPDFRGQAYDVAAALEHLKSAGYPFDPVTHEGGYPETIRYFCNAGSISCDTMGPLAAQQLAKVGFRLEIKQLNWPAFLAEVGKRETAPTGYAGWSMDFPDPSDFFEPILSSEAIQDEDCQNQAFFTNPELDQELKRAHRELDPRARAAMYHRSEEIVRDQAPWAIGMGQQYYEVVQPYVHNYRVDKAHSEDVRFVWLDQEQAKQAHRQRVMKDRLALIRPWGRR